ncbi:hypothetical protein LAZ67_2003581 [Cordylochernes scorpioides]|uniref:Integrase catalytic domain-containing protein n=1 Tax=Cordylochernes scorpioides TaxID=51811 RepID=A0ABY6K320_9ARAC|nr:hypothetical protein LAZ67_2003581 [Cordylochernes scorpioides]
MSIDIAEKVKNCEICQKYQKSKIRQPLKLFPVPDYPWQTVSLDIFYIQKKPHLLVVDRYSGYPEVFALDPPTAINVKNILRETFARFGIPETMMSDNGPPFRSEIMTDFCIRWGIKHLFSSPHLHRSNGLAERNIQTIKNQLIKCRDEGSDPYLAILAYRNTPKNDLPSPAQLCLSRSLRCQIPRITPLYRPYQTNWRSIENAKRKRQSSMKEQYDRNSKSYPKVNVGEDAWCQMHPRETWTPVKISAQADSPQSFEVVTPSGNTLIRNQQFIRPKDGVNEKSQLSTEPITGSPEAQHPHYDSPTMGESSTAPIQRSSEETNIDQREGATTSAGISPEPSGRPRFSRRTSRAPVAQLRSTIEGLEISTISSSASRFCLQHHDGRIRVWRHRGERMLNNCVMHRHTGPVPDIMVWGGIGYHFRSPLVRIAATLNSQRYISEVLKPVVLPYLQSLPTAIFQQDNSRPHMTRIVQRFNRQIKLLPWPARSPDLSPIENMWSMVAEKLTQITSSTAKLDQIWKRVEAAWSSVPQEHLQSLFKSKPRRVAAVINNGSYSGY